MQISVTGVLSGITVIVVITFTPRPALGALHVATTLSLASLELPGPAEEGDASQAGEGAGSTTGRPPDQAWGWRCFSESQTAVTSSVLSKCCRLSASP